MVPAPCAPTAPVPPPAYHRAQAQRGLALHLDALTLVGRLHLLALCRLAVRLARRRCPPPLPAGPGGRPRRYREESLLLLALLRTLWRLSYQDPHDWLVGWPALALACRLPADASGRPYVPCVPSASQQCRSPARLRRACQWPTHPRAPFAQPLLATAVRLYWLRPRVVRLDAGYWGLGLFAWIPAALGAVAVVPWNPERQKNRSCLPPTWTADELGKRTSSERFFGRVFSRFSRFRLQRPPLAGWSAITARVMLTYAATIIVVGLAAQQAGRPGLMRSP